MVQQDFYQNQIKIVQKKNNNQIIQFEDKLESKFNIVVKPLNGKILNKKGKVEEGVNPKNINWKIDVNINFEELNDVIIEDNIPTGLELVPGSIVIEKLIVGVNGNITGETKSEFTANTFPINLGKINEAYRIKYKTNIVDYSKGPYENAAKLVSKEKEEQVKYKVDKINKANLIEKKGTQRKDFNNKDIIEWEIDINKGEESLKNISIDDILPEGLTIVDNSIEIFELTNNGSYWNENEKVTILDTSKFPIEMGDIEKAYRIRYSTNINFGNEYKQKNEYENKAIIKENGSEVNETKVEVEVYRDTLLEKQGVEKSDYEKREISWRININKANHNIKNAILKDEFDDGQELIKKSIEILD